MSSSSDQPASCRSAIRPARPWAARRSSALPIRRGLPTSILRSGFSQRSDQIGGTYGGRYDRPRHRLRDLRSGRFDRRAPVDESRRRRRTSASIASRAAARRHDPQCVVAPGRRSAPAGRRSVVRPPQTPTGDRSVPISRCSFTWWMPSECGDFPRASHPLVLFRRGDHQ
jgi:hypothetical protein